MSGWKNIWPLVESKTVPTILTTAPDAVGAPSSNKPPVDVKNTWFPIVPGSYESVYIPLVNIPTVEAVPFPKAIANNPFAVPSSSELVADHEPPVVYW